MPLGPLELGRKRQDDQFCSSWCGQDEQPVEAQKRQNHNVLFVSKSTFPPGSQKEDTVKRSEDLYLSGNTAGVSLGYSSKESSGNISYPPLSIIWYKPLKNQNNFVLQALYQPTVVLSLSKSCNS